MKIAICYPPLPSKKGIPLLGQNRQFQWFSNPCYIYPVVPAQAATLLKSKGYDVIWLDGIAEKWSQAKFLKKLAEEKPDLIMIETKTPVVKRHWDFIEVAKENWPEMKIVMVGDHVTAMPAESMEKSKVDFILTGGNYDFLLLNLVEHLTKGKQLEAGIWYRDNGQVRNTGQFILFHDLNSLPFIDRQLTHWQLYAYDNGNYKKTPGTYIMAGRDCWWGKCTFCSWTTLYPQYRTRSPENVLDEIGQLIEKYDVKEIMDDTGTLPCGAWLERFCIGMVKRGFNKKINFDCNMRAGILTQRHYDLMAKAGFRFLLYGLESANEKTLEKINKGIPAGAIAKDMKMAKLANLRTGGHLEPHVTCMVGYPWETKEEAENTINLTRKLFDDGLIQTLQATIVIPYPGTPLFRECKEKNLLRTLDWEKYDMRQPIMKTGITDEELKALTQSIYKSFMTPLFIFRKIISIRNLNDLKFFWRAAKALFGHLTDFTRREK